MTISVVENMSLIREHGRCGAVRRDTNDFYENPDDVFVLCAECYVRIECLEYALVADERYGVWGGASEKDRHRLAGHLGPHSAAEIAEFYVTTGSTDVPRDLT